MSLSPASTRHSASVYEGILRAAGGKLVEVSTGGGAHALRVALYEVPACDLAVPAIDVPRLSINLRTVAVKGGLQGECAQQFAGRRHSMFLTPAQAEARWRKDAPSRHINIYFPVGLLEEAREEGGFGIAPDQPLLDAQRPALRPWIDALELALQRDDPFAEEASIGLARLILGSLACEGGRRTPTLRPRDLARIHQHVQEHLGAPLRVAALAALVALPTTRFALAFQESTGRSPHRYVLEQRVERAAQLLRHSRQDLAEIAVDCGFSSQQHLTTTMRQLLGVTPGQLRRGAAAHLAQRATRLQAQPGV